MPRLPANQKHRPHSRRWRRYEKPQPGHRLGAEFQSDFHWHLEQNNIRHVYIRPRITRLNGKVERSHRVDDQDFYQLLDADGITDDIHWLNDKLREWEDYYNYHRPHGALGGQTPYERLLAKTRAEALPKP
jgi:transposase InsO family protein